MTIVFVKRDVARDIVNNKEDISHLITKAKIPESYAKKLI
jgi:hypothetical protein